MAPWFEPLDEALGGTADALKGLTSTAGDAAGGAAGGLFGGLFEGAGNVLLQLVALAVAGWAFVKVVA